MKFESVSAYNQRIEFAKGILREVDLLRGAVQNRTRHLNQLDNIKTDLERLCTVYSQRREGVREYGIVLLEDKIDVRDEKIKRVVMEAFEDYVQTQMRMIPLIRELPEKLRNDKNIERLYDNPEYFYEFGLSSIADFPVYLIWNSFQLFFLYQFLY